jgi:hypothetical protein
VQVKLVLSLAAAALLYAYLLGRNRVRPWVILLLILINTFVFSLLSVHSRNLAIFGLLISGTLCYVACLPRRSRTRPVTVGAVICINAVVFVEGLSGPDASLGRAFNWLIITGALSGMAYLWPEGGHHAVRAMGISQERSATGPV